VDRSYPSALRIAQRLRFRHRALATVFAGLAGCAVAFATMPERAPHAATTLDAAAPAAVAVTAPASGMPVARRVYRYSVVPGGAADRAELARILRSDKVVAAHYAGFDVDHARAITVSAPRAVYVSYRKGDTIYWTARKVMLQAGETLLTDGRNEMRARCANRISDAPRLPVEAHAPSPEWLDALVDEQPDGTAGDIAYVSAPELADGDLVELTGQPFELVWPASATPDPADNPGPARTRLAPERAAGLPWPSRDWLADAFLPPQSGATPATRLLASVTPPVSGAMTVAPDPLPGARTEDPVNGTPPPATSELDPFIPQPDPRQPRPPSNPALDVPEPAKVPEPASAWLGLAALVAMRMQRKKP
jgi:hypothetical protein